MTRATLLHVLENTSALGQAEVRELEQLAQAFPYCQTAHLLLAKAAHDHGTMLAGQRLRRAATYAADRALLRRLIEEVEPAPAEEVEPEAVAAPVPVVPEPTPASAPEVPPTPIEAVIEPAPVAPIAVVTPAPAPEPLPEPAAAVEPELSLFAEEYIDETAAPEPVIEIEPVGTSDIIPSEAPQAEAPQPEEAPANAVELSEVGTALLLDVEGVNITASEPTPEFIPEAEAEIEPATEKDLPAQAPAIRPPAEVGEARFEFGLADPPPAAEPTYELPGLVDEWAASAVTLSLGSVEPLLAATPASAAAAAPAFTPAAFTGDEAVGYAFGESSRLGFSMQLLNLLADKAGTAELAYAAEVPAAPLPPTGMFFEPDPLLLDYWATHRPPEPVLPSSLDLINNFLRRQPRLTRPAMLPPAANTQADLSVRSTRAEPDLVSESLARILVRQGKTARAIEIYEKLMVKQPEKMAYFAAQIQQLQPSA